MAQNLFPQRKRFDDLEAADPVGQPVAGQVGDVGIELPQSVAGAVLADQTRPHHRAVGVDDPAPGWTAAAVLGVGVGEHLVGGRAAVQHAGPPPHAGLGQGRRPQAGLAHRAAGGDHLHLAVEADPANRVEVDAGRALHHGAATAVGLREGIQGR